MGPKLKLKNKELIFYSILAANLIIAQYWKTLDNSAIEVWINMIFSTATLENITDKVKIMKHQRKGLQFY